MAATTVSGDRIGEEYEPVKKQCVVEKPKRKHAASATVPAGARGLTGRAYNSQHAARFAARTFL